MRRGKEAEREGDPAASRGVENIAAMELALSENKKPGEKRPPGRTWPMAHWVESASGRKPALLEGTFQ